MCFVICWYWQMCRNLLKISAQDIEFGQQYWEDNTPELNVIGRRGIKRHRIGKGNYVQHKLEARVPGIDGGDV